MTFMNITGTIGIILGRATETTTGDIFITLLIVMVLFIAFAAMFRIKTEWTMIIILPYALACGSYYSEWVGVIGAILIYLAFLITKNFIFK